MTPIAKRAKRIIETPLGSRVMLPHFGSNLFELIDKEVNNEWRLNFIAYVFEAFYDSTEGCLWDAELEPRQVNFTNISRKGEIEATLKLTTGEEIEL